MAGHVRPRKQWQLQDGPYGTLRRLRCQLAEDGCPESQLVLAKCLLNEAEGDDAKEKESLAVSWLVKAAEQNNQEAYDLLRQCVRTKRGINTKNYRDVLHCLNMSQEEKEARQAARALFNEMTADGTPLTSGKLLQKLHECSDYHKNSNKNENCNSSTDSEESSLMKFLLEEGTVYTEEDLLDLASEIATGKDMTLTMEKDLEAEYFKKLSFRDKICAEPGLTFRMAYVQLLEWSSAWGTKVLRWIFTPGVHHFTAVLLFHWAISFKTMMSVLPVMVFYIALLAMVTSTVNMLCFRQRLRSLKQWTHLLSLMSANFSRDRVESLYMWNTFKPYIYFFFGVVALIFVFPLVPKPIIPLAYLTIVSVAMMVTSFVSLNNCNDTLIILSMAFQFLLQIIPRILFSLSPWEYTGDTMPCLGVILLSSHFRLHVGIPSLLYLFVPMIFLLMAYRNSFQGAYRVLIPHLVCLVWWQLSILFFAESSFSNLIWSCLILATILFFIPLVGVTCIVLIIILINQLISHFWLLLYAVGFVLCVCIPSILAKQCDKAYITKKRKLFTLINTLSYMLALLLLMTFYFSLSSHYHTNDQNSSILSWETYYDKCHKPAWQRKMIAQVEFKCMQLVGGAVVWEGEVELVRIESVTNKVTEVTNFLPGAIQNFVHSFLGKRYEESEWSESHSSVMKNTWDMSYWNAYMFELILVINSNYDTANVFVTANDDFRNFLLNLKQGDHVRVAGLLLSGLGGPRPKLLLTSILCISCNEDIASAHNENVFPLSRGFQFLIHFFFSPLLEYHEGI